MELGAICTVVTTWPNSLNVSPNDLIQMLNSGGDKLEPCQTSKTERSKPLFTSAVSHSFPQNSTRTCTSPCLSVQHSRRILQRGTVGAAELFGSVYDYLCPVPAIGHPPWLPGQFYSQGLVRNPLIMASCIPSKILWAESPPWHAQSLHFPSKKGGD